MVNAQDCRLRGAVRRILVVAAISLLAAGCGMEAGKGPGLSELDRVESALTRGVSGKSDVLFLLGQPDGAGEALFPTASGSSEVWYYEDSAASLVNLKQTILLIYFEDEILSGYQWFWNAAEVDLQ